MCVCVCVCMCGGGFNYKPLCEYKPCNALNHIILRKSMAKINLSYIWYTNFLIPNIAMK